MFGVFFGTQAFFAFLGWAVFSTVFLLTDGNGNYIKYVWFGAPIMALPYIFYIPSSPLQNMIVHLSFFQGSVGTTYTPSYFYLLFGINNPLALPMATSGYHATTGILAQLLALSALMFIRSRKALLPYFLSAISIALYMNFGIEGLSMAPIMDINRLITPFVPVAARGVGMAIGCFNDRRIRMVTAIAVLTAYMYFSLQMYHYSMLPPGAATAYDFFTHLQTDMPYQNMQSYRFYPAGGIPSYQQLICYVFDIEPQNCYFPMPQNATVQDICAENDTLIFSNAPIECGIGSRGTEYFYRQEYIYVHG